MQVSFNTPPLSCKLNNIENNSNSALSKNPHTNPTGYRNLTQEQVQALKAQNLSFAGTNSDSTEYFEELICAIYGGNIGDLECVIENAKTKSKLEELLSKNVLLYAEKMIPYRNTQERQEREKIADFLFDLGEQQGILNKMITSAGFVSKPVIYAAQNGRLKKYLDKAQELDILKEVLQQKDADKNNLLHLVSEGKSEDSVSDIKLLKEKAEKFDGLWNKMQLEENNRGHSHIPLHVAVGCNLKTDNIARTLLEETDEATQKAMLLAVNKLKRTPLAHAEYVVHIRETENKNIPLLLEKAENLGILEQMLETGNDIVNSIIDDLPKNDRLILEIVFSLLLRRPLNQDGQYAKIKQDWGVGQ